MKKPTFDIAAHITDKIIEMIEAGVSPWSRPWATTEAGGLALRENGEPYKGTNQMWLSMIQQYSGYTSPYWMTFNKAKALGGMVRKGQKGTVAVFYKNLVIKDKETGEKKMIPMLKSFTVFNADQIDDLPAKYNPPVIEVTESAKVARVEAAEAFFAAQCADLRHGGNEAFYAPTSDFIQMPKIDTFKTSVDYYSTLAHEYVHWTGGATRLARIEPAAFGTQTYAKEELVAELGSSFTLSLLGLAVEPREDHAAYIAVWLKKLKSDKKWIISASSAAQAAVDHLIDNSHPAQMAA